MIQAEDYFNESGIGLEGCSDIGGGQNIGYLHPGDYVDYYINAIYSGSFQVSYRNASNGFSGGLELQLIDSSGGATTLNQIDHIFKKPIFHHGQITIINVFFLNDIIWTLPIGEELVIVGLLLCTLFRNHTNSQLLLLQR